MAFPQPDGTRSEPPAAPGPTRVGGRASVPAPPPVSSQPGPAASGPAAPGPAAPGSPPPRRAAPGHAAPRGRLALFTAVAAGAALLLAMSAVLMAWRALDRSATAAEVALGRAGQPPATQSEGPDAGPPPTQSIVDTPTYPEPTTPPPLDGSAQYTEHYSRQTLTLNASCGGSMYADLDEPRGDAERTLADLSYTRDCYGPSEFSLTDDVDGTAAAAPGMTPRDCADKIRTAPVGSASLPVRKGIAFCLTTSYAAAVARGDRWRIVLVVVTGVADDGAVSIEASAWNAPR